MKRKRLDSIAQTILNWSFYLLIFATPLFIVIANSELFELPKMFFVWAMTILITGTWMIRCVAQQKFIFHRTILDIPLFIFLITQIISTFHSIDPHTSLWGYYSRFNGGLLSLFAYSLLYWTYVSNMTLHTTLFALRFLLASSLIVVFWGIPAHFGFDPSCALFGFGFTSNCWTEQFKPTVRIFSTLGQPNWLAAWLVAVMPLSWNCFIISLRHPKFTIKQRVTFYFLLVTLFLLALLFTKSKSGFAGLGVAAAVFLLGVIFIYRKKLFSNFWAKLFMGVLVMGTVITFTQLTHRTLSSIQSCTNILLSTDYRLLSTQITSSSDIRCIVWKGAVAIAKAHPILGTGPETFAYSYYQFKPPEHNLTSEWNLLYNKSHNEYLNYLANTGAIGLTTYLLLIITTFIMFLKFINSKHEAPNPKQYLNSNGRNSKRLEINNLNLFRISNLGFRILPLALLAGYSSILVTNFFGFSVVPVQLQFFLYPAMAVVLVTSDKLKVTSYSEKLSIKQIIGFFVIFLVSCYLLLEIIIFYAADIFYNKAVKAENHGEWTKAVFSIQEAIKIRPSEPFYTNELSTILSSLSPSTQDSTASQLVNLAQQVSDVTIKESPYNLNFWDNRYNTYLRLAANEPKYLDKAQQAAQQAATLAPTDAKTLYELGNFYLQIKQYEKSRDVLEKAVLLRPMYRDAQFDLALTYWQLNDKKRAFEHLVYILQNLNSQDEEALKQLDEWNTKK